MPLSSTAILAVCTCTLALSAQDTPERKPFGADNTASIRIRVLNGRNGEPLVQRNLFLERSAMHLMSHAEEHDLLTDDNGSAEAVVAKDGVVLNPIVVDFKSCTPRTRHANEKEKSERFSVPEILASGVVAQNTCSKRTQTPRPGELVLYYRTMNVFERMTD